MVYICQYISHYGMHKLQELQDDLNRVYDHNDRRMFFAKADGRMGMLQDSLEEQVHDYHSMHFGYGNKYDVKEELRTIWQVLWASSDGQAGNPRKILNFFRSRGIYDLKGMAIWQKQDLEEAKEECTLFQDRDMVEQLAWICSELPENG